MELQKIRAGIIGCGSISDIYLKNLSELFQIIKVTACSDRHPERYTAKAEKYHITPMSVDEILSCPDIDMIINLTTPAGHYDINKRALEQGKHVYSEKPIAVTLDEAKELCELADRKGLRLGVAPDTFLGGSIQTSKYIIEKGIIGTPLSAVVSLNRNFTVFGDILPHLHRVGGNMPFDVGIYYMTALAAVLGPARRVSGFAATYRPDRISNRRVDKPWFGDSIHVEGENIFTNAVQYDSGVLATVHFNGETVINEAPHLEIYGTEGILYMGNPNEFGSPVYVRKTGSDQFRFPFTHGFTENSRGVAAADMAWSIQNNRPHRASKEMAYHVLEVLTAMQDSAREGIIYELQSTFDMPASLPEGIISNGNWGPTLESALV